MMDKKASRRALRAARAAVSPAARAEASAAACEALLASPAWPGAGGLALFAPLPEEADPTALAATAPGPVGYPRVVGDDLELRVTDLSELAPVPPYGVREPPETAPMLEAPRLVVVPGLGFTAAGGRIGYGRGYYDRLLFALRAAHPDVVAVGFGFSAQLVDALPLAAHDAPLDAVVTERGFIWTSARRDLV